MTSRRSALVAPLLLPLLLAGCGGDATPVARDPGPTTETSQAGPSRPEWPTQGCDERSGLSVDYTPDAEGADSLEEALAPYAPEGTTIMEKPAAPHRNAQYLVVNEDNEIVAAVEAFRGGGGWLVGYVEKCSG